MKNREKKEEILKKEINRCILLKDQDKSFWLEHTATLPDELLSRVISIVKKRNQRVDEYIEAALAEDPGHRYLAELKADIKRIKEKAFAMDSSLEEAEAEKILKKQLEKL